MFRDRGAVDLTNEPELWSRHACTARYLVQTAGISVREQEIHPQCPMTVSAVYDKRPEGELRAARARSARSAGGVRGEECE